MEHKNKKIKPKIVVAAGISREDIRIVDEESQSSLPKVQTFVKEFKKNDSQKNSFYQSYLAKEELNNSKTSRNYNINMKKTRNGRSLLKAKVISKHGNYFTLDFLNIKLKNDIINSSNNSGTSNSSSCLQQSSYGRFYVHKAPFDNLNHIKLTSTAAVSAEIRRSRGKFKSILNRATEKNVKIILNKINKATALKLRKSHNTPLRSIESIK